MLTPLEAFQILQEIPVPKQKAYVPLIDCLGGILMEDLLADRDFPPFDRVMMDGIAIGNVNIQEWKWEGIAFAGEVQKKLENPNGAWEIMTGSPLPINAVAVIKVEDLDFFEKEGEKWVSTKNQNIEIGNFIHHRGSDILQGQVILKKGTRLKANHIAIAASVGYSKLWVETLGEIHVFSTGDELVSIEETPLDHQIRSSNSIMMQSALQQLGISSKHHHLPDDPTLIHQALKNSLLTSDILLLSGGVSAGKKDYIPGILKDLGFEAKFHKIAQKPGKPLWVGSREDGKVIFAFPGNPISTLVCFSIYFLSWLQDQTTPFPQVKITGLPAPLANLDHWIPIQWTNKQQAQVLKHNGSGDLVHWQHADALAWQKANDTSEELIYFPL
ncbi:molybdopterin molybdotransferase MoeA [Aquirufa aurantiipilula]|uniref:molybdopterin molybdotransferase MoeA n=1 Tax=Aquirufa aurantiipilula TaxID=2696561 RepID=UPI001CAA4D90|nr:molybdopterin molybdotransferase MoeA [Aquirufa aurantiipilula]MBZ1327171.1 molybdopterin molybdotransferase MoeA [Aquirufa aurantiipilula]